MAEPESVVVVESPAKAKTINKYLGRNFKVLASYGHVRDLPAKDGSVDPNDDFAMIWEVDRTRPEAAQGHRRRRQRRRPADPRHRPRPRRRSHFLARAGSAASSARRSARPRSSASSSTRSPRSAVLDAMAHPARHQRGAGRRLSRAPRARLSRRLHAVAGAVAQAARRALGRPRAIGGAAPHLRARARDRSLQAAGILDGRCRFRRRQRAISPRGSSRLERQEARQAVARRARARPRRAVAAINAGRFTVGEVEKKPVKRHPWPPFITSTLQQEASRKLGFSAARTMKIAQGLYEGVEIGGDTVGLITYMRTDGVTMAGEAIAESRHVIGELHGDALRARSAARLFSRRSRTRRKRTRRSARRASRARPRRSRRYLDADQARLYELIWKRALASQMESRRAGTHHRRCRIRRRRRRRCAPPARSRCSTASSRSIRRAATTTATAKTAACRKLDAERSAEAARRCATEQHFTEPPPRYSEASLVKKLEELGIGRPSTYASILSVLRDRAYVRMDREPFHSGGQGAHRHRVPDELLQALCRVRLHRRSRREARRGRRRASCPGSSCCAISGRTSTPRSKRRKS